MRMTKEIADQIIEDSKTLLRKDISKKYLISIGTIRKILSGGFIFDDHGVVNNNTTVLRTIPIEELAQLVADSFSYSEIIRKCGIDVRSSYIRLLKDILIRNSISIDHFNNTTHLKYIRTIKNGCTNNEIFVINSQACSHTIRKRVAKDSLIKYECLMCGNVGEHNGKPLTLQLDHINGTNNDHRLENLRYLCPNCHSQTDTFTGRNQIKKVKYCVDCGTIIDKKVIRCPECSKKFRESKIIRKFEVSKEELEKLMSELPMTKIGKLFNVSDNSIRKRCIALGVPLK